MMFGTKCLLGLTIPLAYAILSALGTDIPINSTSYAPFVIRTDSSILQWSREISDNAEVMMCLGDDVIIPWKFTIGPTRDILYIDWFATVKGKKKLLASYYGNTFIPNDPGARNIQFIPNAGIKLLSPTYADNGDYEVHVRIRNVQSVFVQSVRLIVVESSVTEDDTLQAYVFPGGYHNTTAKEWQAQLGCGKFVSVGSPVVPILWQLPDGRTIPSTTFRDNDFILTLPNPVLDGDYYCFIPFDSPIGNCLKKYPNMMHKALVRVRGVHTRLSLLENGAEQLKKHYKSSDTAAFQAKPLMDYKETIIRKNVKLINDLKKKADQLTSDVTSTGNTLYGRITELTRTLNGIPSVHDEFKEQLITLNDNLEHLLVMKAALESEYKGVFAKAELFRAAKGNVTNTLARLERESRELKDNTTKLQSFLTNLTEIASVQTSDVQSVITAITSVDIAMFDIAGISSDLQKHIPVFMEVTGKNGLGSENTTEIIYDLQFDHKHHVKDQFGLSRIYSDSFQRPFSCADVNSYDSKSGIHTLYLKNFKTLNVYCDQTTDGGGWTVIQRRQDGSVDFNRNWTDYVVGFGNLTNEFWIGLENLHQLTINRNAILRVDLTLHNSLQVYALFNMFYVDNATEKYRLSISGYSGDAGDSLTPSDGVNFTTFDNDNDENSQQCAKLLYGGWWFKNCWESNLNGRFMPNGEEARNGIIWNTKESNHTLLRTEMKIKH